KVLDTTDEPERYKNIDLPGGIQVDHRRELDSLQRDLREIPGVTVLIHDQTCAAEKRRRRKKNQFPDPARRIYIHPEICEGCGDCGIDSSCARSEEHTSELQSRFDLVCRLLLEKKK